MRIEIKINIIIVLLVALIFACVHFGVIPVVAAVAYVCFGVPVFIFFNNVVGYRASKVWVIFWPIMIVVFTCRLVVEWIVGGIKG